jgi:calcineurin-like phosphoesterase
MPTRFPIAKGAVKMCGVIVAADSATGRCLEIERFAMRVERD